MCASLVVEELDANVKRPSEVSQGKEPNNYLFVGANPINKVDPMGLATEAADLVTGWTQNADWKKSGFNFASDLITAFLTKAYPGRDAGLAFNKYARDIKLHPGTIQAIGDYIAKRMKENGVPSGRWAVPDVDPKVKSAFEYNYAEVVGGGYAGGLLAGAAGIGDDLAFALGNAHFGHRHLILRTMADCTKFEATGTIIQRDLYEWKDEIPLNQLPSYGAMVELEHVYKYPPFYHQEEFDIKIEGNVVKGKVNVTAYA
jgi:hypothetical protein